MPALASDGAERRWLRLTALGLTVLAVAAAALWMRFGSTMFADAILAALAACF